MYLNKLSKTLLLLVFPLLLIINPVNTLASATLSSTKVGTTATMTATIPAKACEIYKMGESSTVTVTGFRYSAFSKNSAGTIIGNWSFLDLSESTVRQLTIAGQNITDYSPAGGELAKNASDVIKKQRTKALSSPITYNPNDSANIVVDNIKVLQSGPVELIFSLTYNNGISPPCVHSGNTILNIGSVTEKSPTPTIKPSPDSYIKTSPSPAGIESNTQNIISPSPSDQVKHTKLSSNESIFEFLFKKITDFFKRLSN